MFSIKTIFLFFVFGFLTLELDAAPLRHGHGHGHGHRSTFSRMMSAPHRHTKRASHAAAHGVQRRERERADVENAASPARRTQIVKAILGQETVQPATSASGPLEALEARFIADDTAL